MSRGGPPKGRSHPAVHVTSPLVTWWRSCWPALCAVQTALPPSRLFCVGGSDRAWPTPGRGGPRCLPGGGGRPGLGSGPIACWLFRLSRFGPPGAGAGGSCVLGTRPISLSPFACWPPGASGLVSSSPSPRSSPGRVREEGWKPRSGCCWAHGAQGALAPGSARPLAHAWATRADVPAMASGSMREADHALAHTPGSVLPAGVAGVTLTNLVFSGGWGGQDGEKYAPNLSAAEGHAVRAARRGPKSLRLEGIKAWGSWRAQLTSRRTGGPFRQRGRAGWRPHSSLPLGSPRLSSD